MYGAYTVLLVGTSPYYTAIYGIYKQFWPTLDITMRTVNRTNYNFLAVYTMSTCTYVRFWPTLQIHESQCVH
jgi:hypothetical protein